MAQPHLMTHLPSIEAPEETVSFDFLIRQETYEEDVRRLMQIMGYNDNDLDQSKCKLRHRNKGLTEHAGMVSKDEYMEAIQKDVSFMERLCHMYIQDFICFDYKLPTECNRFLEKAEAIVSEKTT